uniref:gastrula zinc finger protein XlCGF57.1-like n=1 Tax=Myxine glutinosa TaxID=7769 RepID=UPI00358FC60B
MDSTGNGGIGPIPIWLEMHGLTEDVLRVVLKELGIEVFGILCALAEPPSMRARLCSLVTGKFTCSMYAELCCFMEWCRAGQRSERTVLSGRGEHDQDLGGSDTVTSLRIKEEHEHSVGFEEDGRDHMEDGSQDTLTRKFPCTSCSRSFTKADLQLHMEMHRPGSWTYHSDTRHFQEVFALYARIQRRKNSFPCKVCGKIFIHKPGCTARMQTHNGDRPSTSSVCGKTSSPSFDFHEHAEPRLGERPFVSEVCGKESQDKSDFGKIMRIRRPKKPCLCPVCAKPFSCDSVLKRHIAVHMREYRHRCGVCEKPFWYESDLSRHMHIHTGERRFTCEMCQKAFWYESELIKHMRVHTGEFRYACQVCVKKFWYESDLKAHMRHHQPRERHRCSVCGQGFFCPSTYWIHVQGHETEQPRCLTRTRALGIGENCTAEST